MCITAPTDESSAPQGVLPVAANINVEPAAKLSTAVVISLPKNCSGANQAGVPATIPVPVKDVASFTNEIPKSMSFGPFFANRIFEGLISLWTTPTACTEESADKKPRANSIHFSSNSGPSFSTRIFRLGPST